MTMTSDHVLDLLPEYAAGTLHDTAAHAVEEHLARCNPCARELAIIDEVYAAMSLALPAIPPPPWLRERVLAAAVRQGRFEGLIARVAGMLDVARERARDLLAQIDDATRWVPGPGTTQLIHLRGGPRVATCNCGFVRLAAGDSFPTHRHLGDEHVLVLQGGYEDSDGQTLHRGGEAFKPDGSEHHFTALPGADLVYLVVLENTIEIPSEPGFEL